MSSTESHVSRPKSAGVAAADSDRIAQRAYEIWESSGRPDGMDRQHWEQAQRELAEQEGGVTRTKRAASAGQRARKNAGSSRTTRTASIKSHTRRLA